jgi:hypothetical protein
MSIAFTTLASEPRHADSTPTRACDTRLENQVSIHIGPCSQKPADNSDREKNQKTQSVTAIVKDTPRNLATDNQCSMNQSAWPTNDYIPLECVEAALESAPTGPIYEYTSCQRDLDDPEHDRKLRNSDVGIFTSALPPCLSTHFIYYIHNELNRALECINSDKDTISNREIFGLLKAESGMMPNIRGWQKKNNGQKIYNGTGFAQLTKSTTVFPDTLGSPVSREWDRIKDNAECSEFVKDRRLFRKSSKENPKFISQCSFMNIEDNPAYNVIAGLVGYKSNRRQMVSKFPVKYQPALMQGGGLVEVLSEVAYNEGLGPAQTAQATLGPLNTVLKDQVKAANIIRRQDAISKIRERLFNDLNNTLDSDKPVTYEVEKMKDHVQKLMNYILDKAPINDDPKKEFIQAGDLDKILKEVEKTLAQSQPLIQQVKNPTEAEKVKMKIIDKTIVTAPALNVILDQSTLQSEKEKTEITKKLLVIARNHESLFKHPFAIQNALRNPGGSKCKLFN